MNNKGFTLVELLIVVAIIGILVAIAVPNLLDAIDKSKQRATVAEIRLWGIALQDYNATVSKFPPPSGTTSGGGTDCGPYGSITDIPTRDQLVPFSINTLATTDKWLHPLCYSTDPGNLTTYTVASCGKDGQCFAGMGVTPGTWFNFNLDMVLSDGIFVYQPS